MGLTLILSLTAIALNLAIAGVVVAREVRWRRESRAPSGPLIVPPSMQDGFEAGVRMATATMEQVARTAMEAVYGPGSPGAGEDEAPVSRAQEGGGANGNTPLSNGQHANGQPTDAQLREWWRVQADPNYWPEQPEDDEDPIRLDMPLDNVTGGMWTPVDELGGLSDRPRAVGIAPGEDPFAGLDMPKDDE